MSEIPVTVKTIVDALRKAGVEPGDTLMVHSSLKSFGTVENGPDTVIDAVLEAAGPKGHVVMPTLTASYAEKTGGPVGIPYHPGKTPSRVGLITDRFWRRPNAVRSAHPTHSVACIGPKAKDWMAGHDQMSTFGIEGPYAKYVKSEGAGPCKIVFLGVEMVCNTTLHAIEDWLAFPYMATSVALVENPDGSVRRQEVTMAPLGHRGFYKVTDRHHVLMEKSGMVRHTRAGSAEIRVLPALGCIGETLRLELEKPGILLCQRPDCEFCTEGRARIVSIQPEVRARAKQVRERGLSA